MVAEHMLDIIFPPRSLLTGRPSETRGIEAELWTALQFLDDPCCALCGYPFDFKVPAGTHCAACEAYPPAFDGARSAFVYDAESRGIILRFKHGGQTDGLPVFARQLSRAGRDMLASADMLIPVPLHPKRLRQRKFNQAGLLAKALSSESGMPWHHDVLKRVKNTPSQGHHTAKSRRRNVRGAFAVPEDKRELINDKTVILIDDVYTTGATLSACSKTLKRAGAENVFALTLARVVKEQSLPT